jgi:hypothetical protein
MVPPDLKVGVDTVLSAQGWEIQILSRKAVQKDQLKTLLDQLKIAYELAHRFIYPTRFEYKETITIKPHLQAIIDKLATTRSAAAS